MKRIFIYDLDRTVIDSDHRTPYKSNGDLDLDLYYKNKNMIGNDTLLPLVKVMRHQFAKGHSIYICTARTIDALDYGYLADKNIPYHKLMSRTFGDKTCDAILKRDLLLRVLPYRAWNKKIPVVMYDDNQSVLDMLPEIGIIGINSLEWNRKHEAIR